MASRGQDHIDHVQLQTAMLKHKNNTDRVLVPAVWFKVDAYGAAIAGIVRSVELALKSGSLGEGDEHNTMLRVRGLLMDLDPDIEWDRELN